MSIEVAILEAPVALSAHLLGCVPLSAVARLQRRLIADLANCGERRGVLLLTEHTARITLGRTGSRLHVRMSPEELASRRLKVDYVTRGGGCVAHGPGQLAIYPLLPLYELGWSVGDFFRRFQAGLQAALLELNIATQSQPGRFGLWGRRGQLVFFGGAVRKGVTWQGAFLNVAPEMDVYRRLITDSHEQTPASSLEQERQGRAAMPAVRGAVMRHLAESFACPQFHLFSGHPWLSNATGRRPGSTRRAS